MNATQLPASARTAAKLLAVPLLASATWWAYDWLDEPARPTTLTPATVQQLASAWPAPRPVVPQQPIGSPIVEQEFLVRGGYTTSTGQIRLYSRPSALDPENVTVVIDPARVSGAGTNGKALIGRTLYVKGTPAVYRGRPEIRAEHVTLK